MPFNTIDKRFPDEPPCETCKYLAVLGDQEIDDEDNLERPIDLKGVRIFGQSRRHSPPFPTTFQDTWCGDHEPRDTHEAGLELARELRKFEKDSK